MKTSYTLEEIIQSEREHPLEWVMPNGLGGYSSSSVSGSLFRKHHGYLVASEKSPILRKMILSKIDECFVINQNVYHLSSQQKELNQPIQSSYLTAFTFDETPVYHYQVEGVKMTKEIVPVYNQNAVTIRYQIQSKHDIEVRFTPYFQYRSHSDITEEPKKQFSVFSTEHLMTLIPLSNVDQQIQFYTSEGLIQTSSVEYTEPYYYAFDDKTGDPRQEVHFTPYQIFISLKQGEKKTIDMVCLLGREEIPTFDESKKKYHQHLKALYKQAKSTSPRFNRLIQAADVFISKRNSTGYKTVLAGLPWFTDWGRDTMIAYEGLFLQTGRFQEAKEVLLSFRQYEKKGLIPNMFPDEGLEPIYNTVDASLWYIHAIYKYATISKDYAFVHDLLFETMKNIIFYYQTGTYFNIHMDPSDGLIVSGSGLDQVTWMDVRVNDKVITPRHGKAVEINALWFNALSIMAHFSLAFDEDDKLYQTLAKKVKKSFNRKFWNAKKKCLYDVIDPCDSKVRPNQLFAISLPFTMISLPKAKQIVHVCKTELLDVYGIRSLSKFDPEFIGSYSGDIVKRDHAYHMGTSWGFLLGTYMEAVLKSHHFNQKSYAEIVALYLQIEHHFDEGCINGYAEVFDGIEGKKSKGCYTQAWSVAEILRIYKTYLMGVLSNETR